MEEGQRLVHNCRENADLASLNPCCNGRGSKTRVCQAARTAGRHVLILVVMEEGQRLTKDMIMAHMDKSLNPCCNGRGSKTCLS